MQNYNNNWEKEAIKKARERQFRRKLFVKIKPVLLLSIFIIIIQVFGILANKTQDLHVNEKSSVDYSVKLKKNNFYKTDTLGKGMKFIASLIDEIALDYNYEYTISEPIDTEYEYYLERTIEIYDGKTSDMPLFEDKEKILESKAKLEKNINKIKISEHIDVDYSACNSLANAFKATYGLDAAEARVNIDLYVLINGTYQKFEYDFKNENSDTSVSVPLIDKTLNIELITKNVEKNQVVTAAAHIIIMYAVRYLTYLFALLILFYLIKIVLFTIQYRAEQNPMQRQLHKIMKDYDGIVVEAKAISFIEDNQNIIDVSSFEDLLDVSDKIEKPIYMLEFEKEVNYWFIVKDSNDVIRFKLQQEPVPLEGIITKNGKEKNAKK